MRAWRNPGPRPLPQRQTALVAKQAAEVDLLSGGRLRLGIGIGWNSVEYEALGENFNNRGRRSEEQIEVLRMLWTPGGGELRGPLAPSNPRRDQSSPGPASDTSVDRCRQVHQSYSSGTGPAPHRPHRGWMVSHVLTGEAGREAIARTHGYAREAGREPTAIGIEGRVNLAPGTGPETG